MLLISRKSIWRYIPFVASLGVIAYGASSKGRGVVADPVASLEENIRSGKLKLSFEPKHGYLKALLKELDIPWSSQMLVFSKTSMQGSHISPKKPRALYFNDQIYVGWVNGGEFIEIASVDAEQGTHLYTLRNSRKQELAFEKNPSECVACHGGRSPRNVPSLLIRSIYPDADGYPVFTSGGRFTTPRTPLDERWGGWYVSGTHGSQRHMGNVLVTGEDVSSAIDMEAGANITDLKKHFDTSEYLVPHSDIVALMVAEHQMEVQNRIGRLLTTVRNMGNDVSAAPRSRLSYACEPVVESLLGVGEVALTAPIKGTSTFTVDFAKAGPRDKKGRSLRDLDFQTRMFKYRCSPMIYSPVFEGLPEAAKTQIYRRLGEILAGKDGSGRFGYITAAEREAVREILVETKPDFAKVSP